MTKLTELLGRRAGASIPSQGRAESALRKRLGKMADELVQAKNHVALGKREEARLVKQAEALERTADHWGQRARSAARAGDDVVATDALMRKREHEQSAEELR